MTSSTIRSTPGCRSGLSKRRDHHGHRPRFHHGTGLDLPYISQLDRHPIQDLASDLGVGHLPPPEHHRDLYLVALLQEPPCMPRLEIEIVVLDSRPELDFLQLDPMLLLACFASLALFLVA